MTSVYAFSCKDSPLLWDVSSEDEDYRYLLYDGVSIAKKWKKISYKINEVNKKKAVTIKDFTNEHFNLIISKRSYELLRQVFSKYGELLEVDFNGKVTWNKKKKFFTSLSEDDFLSGKKDEEYYVYNVTNLVHDALDIGKSASRCLFGFYFNEEIIKNEFIFRVMQPSDDNPDKYVPSSEPFFTNNFINEIRDIIIQNDLKGFGYREVWNEEKGLIPYSRQPLYDIYGQPFKPRIVD